MINQTQQIKILYQDEFLVAVHKPANMLVHKSMIDKHETIYLMQVLRDQIGQYVYPLHRLDKPTSGVILFALSSESARDFSAVIEQGLTHKTYLAVLRGYAPERLDIDYALKEKLDKKTDAKAKQNKEAQSAITGGRLLASIEIPEPVGRYQQARFSLVQLCPVTGRKHQLRRHMAHIRHPIIGDTTHGDGTQNRFARQVLDFHQLALCAVQFQCFHPYKRCVLNVKSAPSADLQKLVDLFDVETESIYSPEKSFIQV
jgi:tRNA pseudouridine65 synthase